MNTITGFEHLKKGDYNPKVDYEKIIEYYNKLMNDGKQDIAKSILDNYGGKISLMINRERQRKEKE